MLCSKCGTAMYRDRVTAEGASYKCPNKKCGNYGYGKTPENYSGKSGEVTASSRSGLADTEQTNNKED